MIGKAVSVGSSSSRNIIWPMCSRQPQTKRRVLNILVLRGKTASSATSADCEIDFDRIPDWAEKAACS